MAIAPDPPDLMFYLPTSLQRTEDQLQHLPFPFLLKECLLLTHGTAKGRFPQGGSLSEFIALVSVCTIHL